MAVQGRYPSAPIDPAQLAQTLQPFGHGTMLPTAAYTDPAVFRWEQENFFGAGWACVGLSSQLPEPGDQRAEPAGLGSVLIVRDDDRKLRAFANTCRHRGHELLDAGTEVRSGTIICPYHAWTYALSGDLKFARGLSGDAEFDPARWGLTELAAAEWHGLIFVNESGSAASLPDWLRGLEEVVAPYEPERLVTASREVYRAAANWKVISENYEECYHCPAIHPQLCKVSPPNSGQNYPSRRAWVGGWMKLRDGMDTMALDGASLGVPLRGLDAEQQRAIVYLNLFPNVLLSLHPDYVMTHRMVPVSVNQTMIECTWAFAPEALSRPDFDPDYAVKFWDMTNRQDWAACESVQRGLSSRHARPGPLAPNEDGVYNFVTLVGRGYQGEPVWERCPVV
jgi:Rieske 2Fe-2S family protein